MINLIFASEVKFSTGNVYLDLALVLFFLSMNAFFVLSEFTLVSASEVRVKTSGIIDFLKRLILKQMRNVDLYLASCQLGITIASLALGWIGEPALSDIFLSSLERLGPLKHLISHFFAVLLVFGFITSLHIVLGEQIPKLVAITSPEFYLSLIALPLETFTKIFYPFIKFLQVVTVLVAGMIGLKVVSEGEGKTSFSPEELRAILDDSLKKGLLPDIKVRMLKHILDLEQIKVVEVLVPRRDIVAVPINERIEIFIDIVYKYQHSRYPVYEGTIDNILGILHVKDVISILRKGVTKVDRSFLRKPVFFSENTNLLEALIRMREERVHMGVVLDEFGGTRGVVTLSDIIEYVVGELEDEFDLDESASKKIIPLSENEYLVKGTLTLAELKESLGIDLREKVEEEYRKFSTVGGLVFGILGRRPERGDLVRIGNLYLEVKEMQGLRISWLKLKIES